MNNSINESSPVCLPEIEPEYYGENVMRGNSMSDQDIAAQEAIANEWLARNDANVTLVEKQASQYIDILSEADWKSTMQQWENDDPDCLRQEMLRIDAEDRLEEEKENNQAVLEKEEDILSKDWDIEWEIDREKEMNGEGKDFDIFDYLIHDEQFKADICAEMQLDEVFPPKHYRDYALENDRELAEAMGDNYGEPTNLA